MLNESFYIFSILESKLVNNILDDEIKIDGYVSYHAPGSQPTRWGVLFSVNDKLENHLLKHHTDSKYESPWMWCVWIKLTCFLLCGLQPT